MTNEVMREEAVRLTKETGLLPAMKLNKKMDVKPYLQAMYDSGVRIVEITSTSVNAYELYEELSEYFNGKLFIAAGTVLDAISAREIIKLGVKVIVSPAFVPEVIATSHRYGVACYAGAFTATECLQVMQHGADMVKIFPAALGGAKYMSNLKMVYPQINLIPSGGINKDTAAEFIKCGACAISGARNFFDVEMVNKHGVEWVSQQISEYINIVAKAKREAYPLP